MKYKVSGINSLVLVLVAFSSLLSMFALTRIDNIVHQDLYRYGLRFSYEWAMPYWTMTTLVFAMGWFNIVLAMAFQFYVLLYRRKEAEVIAQREALKPEAVAVVEEKREEVEPREPWVPPVETEVEILEKGEEAETLVEAPPEETQTVEEITPQEYVDTEQPEEAEGQMEQEEAEWKETVETEPRPEERFEEPREPVDVEPQEETSYAEEEEREQEEFPSEAAESETPEAPPPEPEIEAETQEREETQTQTWEPTEEHKTSTEETQTDESELTEPYPT